MFRKIFPGEQNVTIHFCVIYCATLMNMLVRMASIPVPYPHE